MEEVHTNGVLEHGTLAMHETLELHELLAMQSNRLIGDKRTVGKISDPILRNIYLESIKTTQMQMKDILQILNQRPTTER